uniref:ADF-H domain-containing protein n=1 Tax=Ciona savignyi TaxID=51511 RepID=H2Y4S1_CIOSA
MSANDAPLTGMELEMCTVDPKLLEISKKFRFRREKTTAAVTIKIQGETIVVDEEFDDITVEELAEELPDHSPRYMLYSYVLKHSDGRISYPLCFLSYSPEGCQLKNTVKFAGCRNALVKALGCGKVFSFRDKETLTEDWLKSQLSFFK